jgi:hypothetical protein
MASAQMQAVILPQAPAKPEIGATANSGSV